MFRKATFRGTTFAHSSTLWHHLAVEAVRAHSPLWSMSAMAIFIPLGADTVSHEYSNSSDLFVRFLSTRTPFSKDFDAQLAREFYENVRCGLLHEARTKGGWTIWAKGPVGTLVSAANKVVYRDNFHSGLLEFIEWYKSALVADVSLQEAFLRKFDSLCT
jgi:hypothetical protein